VAFGVVDGEHEAVFVEADPVPCQPGQLPDPAPGLVVQRYQGPVPGREGGPDQCLDLFLREQLLGELGVPVHPRGADLLDLLPRHLGVVVVDHPEVEPLEKKDVVVQGVLLEGPAFDVRPGLDGREGPADLPDAV